MRDVISRIFLVIFSILIMYLGEKNNERLIDMKVKILFEANGSVQSVDNVCCNFRQHYPEFAAEMEEVGYKYNKRTKDFKLLWVGEFDDDFLNQQNEHSLLGYTNRDVLVRLTHHAEGFYDQTGANGVHVEVYVNGKWHGR